MSGTPCAVQSPAPQLGQHTEEILRELEFDDERIAKLLRERVVIQNTLNRVDKKEDEAD